MMDKEQPTELQYHGLELATTTGHTIEATKKLDGHGHVPDWRHMIDLAMKAINALSAFVVYAEQQIDSAQGLSNVTLGPVNGGDHD